MTAAMSSALGPHNVFVYGSLMAEEVVHVLLTRVPPSSPALVPNLYCYFYRFLAKRSCMFLFHPTDNSIGFDIVQSPIQHKRPCLPRNFTCRK
jgi:hypothetical protein